MSEVLIKVEGVSKKFCKTLKHSMYYGVQDVARNLVGISTGSERLRPGEFWSLSDVSFELRRGECLGLIGPNGAGKSTLLKLLNGILAPDTGRIELRGRIAALIELGAGFHPQLTGKENIYINGAILGLCKDEIDRKLEAIIEFSELGDFIDTPVKFYSSGMYVRLGFAVASQVEPDILLIDEVLAVGDAGFRAKCYDLIHKRLQNTAVVLVTHDMSNINRICNKLIFLEKGNSELFSNIRQGIDRYLDVSCKSTTGNAVWHSTNHCIVSDFKIDGLILNNGIISKAPVNISFELRINLDCEISLSLSILTRELTPVMITGHNMHIFSNRLYFNIKVPELMLIPGQYTLSLAIFNKDTSELLAWLYNVVPFNVKGDTANFGVPVILNSVWESLT